MKQLVLVLTGLILLAACAPAAASPTAPTPVTSGIGPTRAPASPSAPAAPTVAASPTVAGRTGTPGTGSGTPGPITINDVNQQAQPNGEIRTTARAAAEGDLGVGQIEVASPEKMALGETRTIRLRISPATQLVSTTPIAVPVQTTNLPGFVYKFSGNVQLYPVIIAELRAVTFVVLPAGPVQRDIQSGAAAEWSWLVNSKAAGQQDLSISLQIPAIVNGVGSEISTNPLDEIPVSIRVDPAPGGTPAPGSLREVAAKSIADNMGAIVIALIGLLGTILGIIIKMRLDEREHNKGKK